MFEIDGGDPRTLNAMDGYVPALEIGGAGRGMLCLCTAPLTLDKIPNFTLIIRRRKSQYYDD
jgi:hypothetical protein